MAAALRSIFCVTRGCSVNSKTVAADGLRCFYDGNDKPEGAYGRCEPNQPTILPSSFHTMSYYSTTLVDSNA